MKKNSFYDFVYNFLLQIQYQRTYLQTCVVIQTIVYTFKQMNKIKKSIHFFI